MFRLVGAFAYLFVLTKVAALGALAVLFIVLPINYFISDQFLAKYINKMAAGDARTQKIVEIVNSVRVIKYYAWEKPLRALMEKLRSPELEALKALMGSNAMLTFSFTMASPVMQLAIYAILIAAYPGTMSVLVFFQSFSLISIIAMAIVDIPTRYTYYLQLRVSSQRITKILSADERGAMYDGEGKALSNPVPLGSDNGTTQQLGGFTAAVVSSPVSDKHSAAASTTLQFVDVTLHAAPKDTDAFTLEIGEVDSPDGKDAAASGKLELQLGDVAISNGHFAWARPERTAVEMPSEPFNEEYHAQLGEKPAEEVQPLHKTCRALQQVAKTLWKRATRREMNNVNFEARAGELVMIVGKVGSGKTSLISPRCWVRWCACIGSVERKGRVAFVPRSTHGSLNATVRKQHHHGHAV